MEIPLSIVVTVSIFLFTSAFGGLVWLIRLESTIKSALATIERLEKENLELRKTVEDQKLKEVASSAQLIVMARDIAEIKLTVKELAKR